jgi:glutamate carboxypeptidase
MTVEMQALQAYMESRRDEMVAALGDLVGFESPSHDEEHLDRLARHLADRFRDLGAHVKVMEQEDRGDHVRVLFPAPRGGEREKPALILGHFDTVWPVGTLVRRPYRVEDGRAWGPGTVDMKGGLVIAEYALRAIAELGLDLPRPVTVLMNADEEVGSQSSRSLIETEALRSAYVLVLEPAGPGGALKTERKGVGAFTLRVAGRASHAGAAPEEGVSAIEEMARQILRLHGFSDPEGGTTVNVGVVRGGTRSNVVAAQASARIDVRARTQEEAERITAVIRGLEPFHPEAQVTVVGGFGRGPMERTPEIVALFETARRLGSEMGLALEESASGGGSDGNFCAALGVPTLDGLGPVGRGAHADDEHVEIASLPERAALLAALLCELD